MRDGWRTYSIVYDRDELHGDPQAQFGTRLICADWLEIRADSESLGMYDPVLVRQFLAGSFEEALRIWYEMRGLPPYKTTCTGAGHIGPNQVDWRTDNSLCLRCALLVELEDFAKRQKGGLITHRLFDQFRADLTHVLTKGPLSYGVRGYTFDPTPGLKWTLTVEALHPPEKLIFEISANL